MIKGHELRRTHVFFLFRCGPGWTSLMYLMYVFTIVKLIKLNVKDCSIHTERTGNIRQILLPEQTPTNTCNLHDNLVISYLKFDLIK